MLTTLYNSCERTSAGPWIEVTNLASAVLLIVVGLWFTFRPRQPGLARPMGVLALLMGLTGFLAHLWPNLATEVGSLVPLILFFGATFFAYARDILRLSRGEALTASFLIVPFVAASLPLFLVLDGPAASAGYAALPVFLLGMAVVLRQRYPDTGWRVLVAAVVLIVGLGLRALDLPLCLSFPLGTHALWHLASTVVVAILICTYRRHLLAAPVARG